MPLLMRKSGLASTLDGGHPGVLGRRLLGVLQHDRVGLAADERQLERVEEVRLGEGRLVAQEQRDDLADAGGVVGEIGQGRRPHVVGDDRDVVVGRLDEPLEERGHRAQDLVLPRLHPARAREAEPLAELAVFEHDGDRDGRFRGGEVGDVALDVVLEDGEVLLLQTHHDLAGLLVVDDGLDLHDVGDDLNDLLLLEGIGRDGLLRLLLELRVGRRLLVGARVLLLRRLRRRAPRLGQRRERDRSGRGEERKGEGGGAARNADIHGSVQPLSKNRGLVCKRVSGGPEYKARQRARSNKHQARVF